MPWSYAIDEDSESWAGYCATREEAIEEGISEFADQMAEHVRDPDVADSEFAKAPYFYIGFGEPMDPADAFDAEDIVEQAAGYVYDNTGSEDQETIEVSTDDVKKLQELLSAWARECVKVVCWTINKIEKVPFPLDQLPKEDES